MNSRMTPDERRSQKLYFGLVKHDKTSSFGSRSLCVTFSTSSLRVCPEVEASLSMPRASGAKHLDPRDCPRQGH